MSYKYSQYLPSVVLLAASILLISIAIAAVTTGDEDSNMVPTADKWDGIEFPPAPAPNYRDVAGEPKKMVFKITGSDGKVLHEEEAIVLPPHWCDACQDSLSPLGPISRLGLQENEFGSRYCMNPDCELFEEDIIFPLPTKLKKQLETSSNK